MSRDVVEPEWALVDVLSEIRDALERIADALESKPDVSTKINVDTDQAFNDLDRKIIEEQRAPVPPEKG